jgi:predicted glutamine amidotransferase
MCRWMAYSGDPVLASDLLFRPEHSIIDQSLHAKLGGFTTNGDGFGIGWYGEGDGATPVVYKSTHPAWNDENLREVATQIRTPLLFAHVRASSGTPVQRGNCHPFRYGRWLWMHNGSLAGFHDVKHDLQMAVDASLYPEIEGSTDTETLFFLALTFGLADDPPTAVARAVGFVEDVGRRHGVEYPVHMTVATTDGESIWVFRYSSEKATSSLYYSADVSQVRRLYPELDVLDRLGDDTRFIVSEPLRDLPGMWNEVPEGSWALIRRGEHHTGHFEPTVPAGAGAPRTGS